MREVFEWIGKHKKFVFVIIICGVVGIPFIIHVLFKLYPDNDFFVAEWTAGDLLQYYASIVTGLATVFLAYAAIRQTDEANALSDRMLKAEEVSKKSYLSVNVSQCKAYSVGYHKLLVEICFKIISDIPLSRLDILDGKKNLFDDIEKSNPKLKGLKFVNEITFVKEFNKNGSMGDICRIITFKTDDESGAYLVSFIAEVENVLGYKSKQAFTLAITPNGDKYRLESYRAKAIE